MTSTDVSTAIRYAITATTLGAFGVAWTDRGIARTWLHDRTIERTGAAIRAAYPDAIETPPPAPIEAVLRDVARLLEGQRIDLGAAQLDIRGIPDFHRRVYEVARTVPAGGTITYGAIAKAMGEEPMQAREVGVALSQNPFAPIVPCHRVVAAGGQLGGYSAPGGASTKRRLLEIEGAAIVAAPAQQVLFEP